MRERCQALIRVTQFLNGCFIAIGGTDVVLIAITALQGLKVVGLFFIQCVLLALVVYGFLTVRGILFKLQWLDNTSDWRDERGQF